MSRNLDMALLRSFVSVADHLNMTVAGRALHLTQSAISQHIAKLESQFGALFFREKRTIRLTPEGERLLGKVRQLVLLNDELWSEVNQTHMQGTIRLGAPYDLVGTWLPPILKSFSQHFPQVDIELICLASPELKSAVTDGMIDLALVEEPVGKGEGECLAVDQLVWVGAKGGCAYLKSPLPVSMVAQSCAFRPVVLQALENGQLSWRTLFESGSLDATQATIRSDLAVSAWLASTVPEELERLNKHQALPDLPSFAINLYCIKGQGSHALEALVQQIRQTLGGAQVIMRF